MKIGKHCREDPGAALRNYGRNLNAEEFDYCIEKDPYAAFWWADRLELTKEEMEACCRLHPRVALRFWQCREIGDEVLDWCIRQNPGLAIQSTEPWSGTKLELSDEQFEFCATVEPSIALYYSSCRMTDRIFEFCARAAPGSAIQYTSERLTDQLFQDCSKKDPWAALKFATDRLTDEEILQYCGNRTDLICDLLSTEPRHPLTKRLMQHRALLDRDILEAAAKAIVPHI